MVVIKGDKWKWAKQGKMGLPADDNNGNIELLPPTEAEVKGLREGEVLRQEDSQENR